MTIYIERIQQELDGFKKIVSRPMKIVFEGLVMQDKKYNLVGLTSVEGENLNIRYKTYTVKGKDEWFEYDGQLVRVVDRKHLEKQCALVLYYEKV